MGRLVGRHWVWGGTGRQTPTHLPQVLDRLVLRPVAPLVRRSALQRLKVQVGRPDNERLQLHRPAGRRSAVCVTQAGSGEGEGGRRGLTRGCEGRAERRRYCGLLRPTEPH